MNLNWNCMYRAWSFGIPKEDDSQLQRPESEIPRLSQYATLVFPYLNSRLNWTPLPLLVDGNPRTCHVSGTFLQSPPFPHIQLRFSQQVTMLSTSVLSLWFHRIRWFVEGTSSLAILLPTRNCKARGSKLLSNQEVEERHGGTFVRIIVRQTHSANA